MANNTLEYTLDLLTQQFTAKLKQAVADFKEGSGQMASSAQSGSSGVRSAFDSASAGANSFKATLTELIGLIGGGMLFHAAGKAAVEFNSTLENSRIGLAAIVRTFLDLSGSQDQYGKSMEIAKDIQKQLQIEGLKTVATYEQLLVALQEGIGPAFKKGFNPQQVVEFTSLMTQAAAALSLPMDQLGQEIRSILDGTIDRNSRVAMALGITNEKVKELAASGKLFDYLKGKLNEFGKAGDDAAKTWTGAFSNLIDAVRMGLGTSFNNAFEAIKKHFLDLQKAIVTIDEKAGTFTFNEKIEASLTKASAAITAFINSITKTDMERYLSILADTAAAVVGVFGSVIAMMKTVADTMGGSIPTIAKYTTEFLLFAGGLKVFTGITGSVFSGLTTLNTLFGLLPKNTTLATVALSGLQKAAGLFEVSLTGLLARFSALGAAFAVGWGVGTMLNEFDTVKKAGILMAEGLTLAWLKAKQAWTFMRGGDSEAVQREVDEAKRIYKEMYDGVGKEAQVAAQTQVAEQKKVTAAVTETNTVKTKVMTEDEARDKLKAKSTASIKDEIEKLNKAYDILKNSGASQEDLAIATRHLKEETAKLNEELKTTTKEEDDAVKEGKKAILEATKKANAEALENAKETYRRTEEAAKESAAHQQEAVGKAIDIIKERYKKLGDEVKEILKSIADRQQSLTAELSDMARSGMSTGDAWKDMKKQADDYYRSAKEAAEAGNMDKAVQYADKAKEAYKQLNHEVKEGNKVVVSAPDALKASMEGTKRAGELGIDALQQQKDAKARQMAAMDQATGGALSSIPTDDEKIKAAFDMIGTYSQQADKQFATMTDAFAAIWDEGSKKADESFGRISEGLKALTRQIKTLQGEAANIAAGEQQQGSSGAGSSDASPDTSSGGKNFNWDLGGTIMKEMGSRVEDLKKQAGESLSLPQNLSLPNQAQSGSSSPDSSDRKADKVVEIRWSGGALQGDEKSVEDFLREIQQAGLMA